MRLLFILTIKFKKKKCSKSPCFTEPHNCCVRLRAESNVMGMYVYVLRACSQIPVLGQTGRTCGSRAQCLVRDFVGKILG